MSNTHPTIAQYKKALKHYTEIYNKIKDMDSRNEIYLILRKNFMLNGLCNYFYKTFKVDTYETDIFKFSNLGRRPSDTTAVPADALLRRIEFLEQLIKQTNH